MWNKEKKENEEERLHIWTPLIESTPLSLMNNAEIWLKMDAIQSAGSFKIRGIGYRCQQAAKAGCSLLISSSGLIYHYYFI